MAALNPLTRELVFKIVYYGPGLGGKTTSLQYIHGTSKPEQRGNMVSLATDTERTLYFDFVPLQLGKLGNLTIRLQLFTVPGQVHYGATRKLVLAGADGLVFVADSQRARFEANMESLEDLNANLAEQGRALSQVPHIFAYNKRDLPNIVDVSDLDRRLNLFSTEMVETTATSGAGVYEGLEAITRLVFNNYKAELPQRGARPVFVDAEDLGLSDAIRDLTDEKAQGSTLVQAAPVHTLGSPVRDPSLADSIGEATASLASSRAKLTGGIFQPPAEAEAHAAVSAVARTAASATNAPRKTDSDVAATFESVTAPEPRIRTPHADLALVHGPKEPPRARADLKTKYVAEPQPAAERRSDDVLAGASVPLSFSFSPLWPEGDRDTVLAVERALSAGDDGVAIVQCDRLLARTLAAASVKFEAGDMGREPAMVAMMLGLDRKKYLAFRAAVRSARQKQAVTREAALDCFVFANLARRTLDSA